MKPRASWFGVRQPLPASRAMLAKVGAFVVPLLVWCAVSYIPWIWHPMIRVTDGGDSSFLRPGSLADRAVFQHENDQLKAASQKPAVGVRANPIFLPAPHEVAKAFYTAFTTPPLRRGEPWLHESLWHSVTIIFQGFVLATLFGVPLGILCGTFDLASKLTEPFVDFIRYMPAPVFGALMVAIFDIYDGPKIAIIFIGTFFQMVLVVANTTRTLDVALLEAAQTLGANRAKLVRRVVLPGILPNLYNDMRILLGAAWCYLIIAELIGAASGISYFINQQGKYRHYANVWAGIVMIGMIGFITDQVLAGLGQYLFPWSKQPVGGLVALVFRIAGWSGRGAVRSAKWVGRGGAAVNGGDSGIAGVAMEAATRADSSAEGA